MREIILSTQSTRIPTPDSLLLLRHLPPPNGSQLQHPMDRSTTGMNGLGNHDGENRPVCLKAIGLYGMIRVFMIDEMKSIWIELREAWLWISKFFAVPSVAIQLKKALFEWFREGMINELRYRLKLVKLWWEGMSLPVSDSITWRTWVSLTKNRVTLSTIFYFMKPQSVNPNRWYPLLVPLASLLQQLLNHLAEKLRLQFPQ